MKIKLTKIDSEPWQFILYRGENNQLFAKFYYSPQSYIDLNLLIKLTEEESNNVKINRIFLIELATKIRNDYTKYIGRGLDLNQYQFS